MGDITNPRLIYAKGFLFLACGALAATILIVENPTFRTALLVALTAWCFARAYYFAFYVIEHYVDPSFRFSGLLSFVTYMMRRSAQPPDTTTPGSGGGVDNPSRIAKPPP